MRSWNRVACAAVFAASLSSQLQAAPLGVQSFGRDPAQVIPVVVFGQDARRLPQVFAAEHNLKANDVIADHTASGLIQCGNAHGAGQLTLVDDVITTAAHVLFDENGLPRARACSFDLTVKGQAVRIPIDLASVIAGSKTPYDVAVSHDWAVARLVHSATGVKPYGIASDIHENESVTFVARGHIDWGEAKKLSMETCLLHDKLSVGSEGTREFSFDCDTGDGASGGALMFDHNISRVGAILVGWRSSHPFRATPFAPTHYNFAVTIEGAFRQAIYAAAGKYIVQK